MALSFTLINLSDLAFDSCLKIVPAGLKEGASWKSLVCGQQIASEDLKFSLIATGLIHIFVVSGAQLTFLSKFLEFTFKKLKLQSRIATVVIFLLLTFYTFFAHFQPPLVRGLILFTLVQLNSNFHFFWTNCHLILLSGIFALLLQPDWVGSLSLILSWTAALASSEFSQGTYWKNASIIYTLLLVPMWGIANIHPITIVFNILLGPFFGYVLFPFALLLTVLPIGGLCYLFDKTIYLIGHLQIFIPENAVVIPDSKPFEISFLWAYLLGLQYTFHFYTVLKNRAGVTIRKDTGAIGLVQK